MAARSAKTKLSEPGADLKLLREMMSEQGDMAERRARASSDRFSATWMAKGDHLVLLIVNAQSKVSKRKLYVCEILEVVEENG